MTDPHMRGLKGSLFLNTIGNKNKQSEGDVLFGQCATYSRYGEAWFFRELVYKEERFLFDSGVNREPLMRS